MASALALVAGLLALAALLPVALRAPRPAAPGDAGAGLGAGLRELAQAGSRGALWRVGLPLLLALATVPLLGVAGPPGAPLDLDAGLQVAWLSLVLAALALRDPAAPLTALAAVAWPALALGVAWTGPLLLAGTLRPDEIVALQDGVIRFGIPLPAWGVFQQPVAFALHAAALALLVPAVSGAGLRVAHAALLALCCLLGAMLFLGGGAVPYLETEALVSALATLLPGSLLPAAAAAVQGVVFLAKAALLLVLTLRVGARLTPSLEAAAAARSAWLLVALGATHALATAAVLARHAGGPA